MENKKLAKYLDYTNLYNNTSRKEIKKLVDDAIKYNMGGICIAPCWVSFVQNRLKQKCVANIPVIAVPNWKIGGGLTQLDGVADYCFETCDEIDYIWNVYAFGDLKKYDKIKEELDDIRKRTNGKLKVIIETYYLRIADEKIHKQGIDKTIKKACELVNNSGADFIKTDSGLFKRPEFETLLEDATLLVKYSKIPVKAAGGIKTKYHVDKLIEAGVKRIGTSNAIPIINSDVNIEV